jgi:hypothetical protein
MSIHTLRSGAYANTIIATAPGFAGNRIPKLKVGKQTRIKTKMALVKKAKLAVFDSRAYEVINNRSGEKYSGFINSAFDEKGETVKFTSPGAIKVFDIGSFEEAAGVEFNLFGRMFKDEVKWSTDKKGAPQQQS